SPSLDVLTNEDGTIPWAEASPPSALPEVASANQAAPSFSLSTWNLLLTGFNFSVPQNATILGIQASITRYWNPTLATSGTDRYIRIVNLGGTGVENKATATPWPTSAAAAVYGSSSDLWSETWTPTIINAQNFGIAIAATITSPFPYVEA